MGIRQLGKDLGISDSTPLPIKLYTDSTSALGTACKRGSGKIRHIEIGSLWLQQVVADKRIQMAKIDGKKNPPDILTKHGERAMLDKVADRLGFDFTPTN